MNNFKNGMALAAAAVALFSCSMKQSADFIGYNGRVYTVDSAFTVAQAFAVRDGIFVAVGSTDEILSGYESKNKMDFEGGAVYPGLMDAHCHLSEMGKGLLNVDLRKASSFDEILRRLEKAYKENPDRRFLAGDGWDQNLWEDKRFPDNTQLNRMFPDIPVVLSRIDFHAVLANEAAIRKMGLDPQDENLNREEAPVKDGRFTGIFMENMATAFRTIAEYGPREMKDIFLAAQQECFKYGLTAVCDADEDYLPLKIMDTLVNEGKLKLRIDAFLMATQDNFKNFRKPYENKNLKISTLKLYRDGALGSRGALLLEPYSDDPGNSGLEATSLEEFRRNCRWAYEHGFRVATHCIGDRANREALDIYGEFLKGKNDLGWRIEHAQIIDPSDLDKFSRYSIIPSVQPTHCTSDMLWADERLGERLKNAYRYRDLLDQLGWIPSGTDFPIESVNPVYTFFAAVYRKNADFLPDGGFQMENALTKEQALRSMTIWAAKSVFEDGIRGSIEPGKYADFITADRDFMTVPEKEIPGTRITATYLGGEKVY